MTSCKDCTHGNVCRYNDGVNKWCKGDCPHFKDQNLFVKLPCKVGDKVYHIQSVFDDSTLKSKNVIKPRIIDFVSTSSFLAESQGLIISEKDFNKTVFLTREEAEKHLKERENNG